VTAVDAAWFALRARQIHGERSPEYKAALAELDTFQGARPRSRRTTPRSYRCGLCMGQGHNARRCPKFPDWRGQVA